MEAPKDAPHIGQRCSQGGKQTECRCPGLIFFFQVQAFFWLSESTPGLMGKQGHPRGSLRQPWNCNQLDATVERFGGSMRLARAASRESSWNAPRNAKLVADVCCSFAATCGCGHSVLRYLSGHDLFGRPILLAFLFLQEAF